MPTYIRFSEDHSVVVLESFEEIGQRIPPPKRRPSPSSR